MLAWAGSSEIIYPSDDFMWAHCLTIPRELTLEGNVLKQQPVSELKELRTSSKSITGFVENEKCILLDFPKENSYELEVQLQVEKANVFGISLFHHDEESFPITFHREKALFLLIGKVFNIVLVKTTVISVVSKLKYKTR